MITEELNFDWRCLPKQANKYIAMDRCGMWNSFEKYPIQSPDGYWKCQFLSETYCISPEDYPDNYSDSWEDSIFLNPKYDS